MTINADPGAWTTEDKVEFFRQLGLQLESQFTEGEPYDFSAAIRAIADEIGEGLGEAADRLGDELADAATDGLDDVSKGLLVWMRFVEGLGASAGIELMDFGTGKLFVVEPPNAEGRTDWEVLAIVDPEDRKGIREAVLDFISRGWTPDHLTISEDAVTREDVEQAYAAAFDSGMPNDWAAVQDLVSRRLGVEYQIETHEQRRLLLTAWLDMVLS